MLTIIASMDQEIAGLRQELRPGRTGGAPAIRSDGGPALDLSVVGVGKKSGANVRTLLDRRVASSGTGIEPPMAMLLLGFTGAVEPGLEIGDLVLSSRYHREKHSTNSPNSPLIKRDEAGVVVEDSPNGHLTDKFNQEDYLLPDPVMWEHAMAAAAKMDRPVAQVESLTVGELVTTPQIKECIRRRYKVSVVDMEDYWVASAACDFGVPFVSARVVLDRADQGLPGYLPGMVRSNVMAVLLSVGMPWRIPVLLGLARRLPMARRTLTRFALHFCDQVMKASEFGYQKAPKSNVVIGTSRGGLG